MPRSFVPFAVTVCGIEELPGHCDVGVSHVLSIIDPTHPELEAFGRYGEHERLELRFHDIIDPTEGMLPPQREHVEAVLGLGRDLMAEPEACRHLLVHCHMGISRSTAALTMILAQARPDRPAADAVAAVAAIREKAWPNLRMIELADALLGREGELVAAVRARHRDLGLRRPEVVQFMRENGRGREVADLP
ncbi:MAG TPA: protein-tyrosine-phosphatase [Azospirillum sp.]